MDSRPDSALTILDEWIDSINSERKPVRMYYYLLLTKAQDKCFIEHTSDSIMIEVADYYRKHGTTRQKMEALYYLGSVYRDLGDAPRAINWYQQAAEASKEKTEHDLLRLIYGHMGTLFFYQGLEEEGGDAYRKSFHHEMLWGDSATLSYAYIDMARIHTSISNVDSTLYYYNKAIELAEKAGKKELAEGFKSELADIYLQLGELDMAQDLLPNIKRDGKDFLNWGELYFKKDKLDSAEYYFQKAFEIGNVYVKSGSRRELYNLEKLRGNDKQIIYYLEQYIIYKDSIQKITDIEGIKRVQSLYNYQHIESENTRLLLANQRKNYITYIILSIFVLFIVSGYWLFLSYRRKKERQMEQQKRTLYFKDQESQVQIEVKDREISQLRRQLKKATIDKNQELTTLQLKLNNALLEYDKLIVQNQLSNYTFRASSIYRLLHENYNNPEFKMKEHWSELQEEIDNTYNNFTSRLYVIYPKLSETELRVSLLLKAEIPLKNIAMFLHKEKNTISNIRKRLYEKTHGETGKPEQWDKFIISL